MNVGILDHESLRLGGGQLVVAQMAAFLSAEHRVEIIHSGRGYDVNLLGEAFDLDMDGVGERVRSLPSSFSVPGPRSAARWLLGAPREEKDLTASYDLFVFVGHGAPPFSAAPHSLVYCHFPFESAPGPESLVSSPRWKDMSALERRARLHAYRRIWARRMSSYDMILANSLFTADWIKRRWKLEATVLYPPVQVGATDRAKERRIVSIGRFVASDHKKLSLQLEAFERFVREVSEDWRLVLIGFCADLPQDREFAEELRARAKGLPVEFMVNAGRAELEEQLARATLYWHATGLGEVSEVVEPQKMEHFGIATVEAMGYGCVPIVPAVGGQAEIVRHGSDEFLCNDLEDLVESSILVAEDTELWKRLSDQARSRSRSFDVPRFEEQFRELIRRCLNNTTATA